MRKRSKLVECSFAHGLDRGMRRAWLRGRENIAERHWSPEGRSGRYSFVGATASGFEAPGSGAPFLGLPAFFFEAFPDARGLDCAALSFESD
jgi:hypothetical protein